MSLVYPGSVIMIKRDLNILHPHINWVNEGLLGGQFMNIF